LVLTHFSQRYSDVGDLANEARAVFGEGVLAADDFLTVVAGE